MGKRHASILAFSQVYTKTCIKFMKLEISKSNSHRVDSFDRGNHNFMVHETIVPREGRPIGHFSVNLPNKWCDCGKYQAKHMPCSHVIATCSNIKYDYWSLISDVYKEETVLKVYDEAFPPIPNKGYWPQYEGIKLCHNPLMQRVKKGRPKSKHIRTEMNTT
ncbi:uncharacterized protein [Cicer arietinum]|uniref:Uncharacterized protein LOC101502426 n=1 Tax=Cicer arietinum TaxID=3827 RepID=A0A1S2Z2H9_CICAR|nr:uncharacterized protein LOC101502426 [Cicer arietinum]